MGVKEAVIARFREMLDQRNMRLNELAYRSGGDTLHGLQHAGRAAQGSDDQPDQEALRRAGHNPRRVLQRAGL